MTLQFSELMTLQRLHGRELAEALRMQRLHGRELAEAFWQRRRLVLLEKQPLQP